MKKTICIILTLTAIVLTSFVCSLKTATSGGNDFKDKTTTIEFKRRIDPNRPREEVYAIINHPIYEDEEEQIRMEIFYGDLELLAQLIQAEAGNQDLKGKQLVADVVLNRVDRGFNNQNTITDVIFYSNAFTSVNDGNFDKAAWNMTQEAYDAAYMEMTGERLDYRIVYFTAGGYGKYGTPAYQYGDHFFCYE